MQGGSAKYVSSKYDKLATQNEKDCALRVKYEYPGASSATWKKNETCWAEFGETLTNLSDIRTCHFQRNISIICIILTDVKLC